MTHDCLHCDELRNEVLYWKAEAQRNADVDLCERFRRSLGLTPAEAWVVGQLYAAGGAVVRSDRLIEDLPGKHYDDRLESSNTVDVLICRIRKKAPATDVLTSRALGYRLSDNGLAHCKDIAGA